MPHATWRLIILSWMHSRLHFSNVLRVVCPPQIQSLGRAAGGREAPARVVAPASCNSLTRRSCKVLSARSTRPLAGLEIAQMMSMLSLQGAAKLGHAVAAQRARLFYRASVSTSGS